MLQLEKTWLRVHRISLCDFLQLCVNLQLSQNNNPTKKENVASEIFLFFIIEDKN